MSARRAEGIAAAAAMVAALALAPPARADAAPEARLRLGAPLGELPRFGVNLGGRTVWGAEQLMSNVLRNPGLEAALDGALVVVGRATPAGIDDDSPWTARPAGFWAGARFEVLSGPAAGSKGTVRDNQRPAEGQPDRLRLDLQPPGLQPGDVIALQGLQDASAAPLWWTQGQVLASPTPRPGSPGQRAVRLLAAPGQPAALFHHLDSLGERAGKLLPVTGRWRLSVWLRSGSADASVRISFGRQGRASWLDRRVQPGREWEHVEIEFDTRDDGPTGSLMLGVMAERGDVFVDDVELGPVGAPTPGGFRRELVDTLRALRPGYLRDWQGQLADSPANRAAEPLARRPTRYRPGTHELQFAYSLPEFLALAADVGARPWVILPAAATPDEAREFGRALALAWQRHRFDEIVVEHGNEHWNQTFRPAGIADAATLAGVADRAFAALREGAGPLVPLHRVVGTQYVDAAAAGRMARTARQVEGIAVAPYFLYRMEAAEGAQAALERALHEGADPLRRESAEAAAQGKALDVYEVNLHTTFGSASSAQRDAVVTHPAAGAALARRLLQAAQAGVKRQAVYSLAGYDTFTTNGKRELVQLFGITRDLASAANWRPTGEAVLALNEVVGGAAHAAACEGAACGELTAVSFGAGARWAIVSSAAAPLRVALPCSSTMRLRALAGTAQTATCVSGEALVTLEPRSWLTATSASGTAAQSTRR